MEKITIELTPKQFVELWWFVKTVQGWGSGGPYGDGEEVTNKKGYALMQQISKKLDKQTN